MRQKKSDPFFTLFHSLLNVEPGFVSPRRVGVVGQFVEPVARVAQLALLNQGVPHASRKLAGRRDGHDRRALAAAERTPAQAGLLLAAHDLQPALERMQGLFEFISGWSSPA